MALMMTKEMDSMMMRIRLIRMQLEPWLCSVSARAIPAILAFHKFALFPSFARSLRQYWSLHLIVARSSLMDKENCEVRRGREALSLGLEEVGTESLIEQGIAMRQVAHGLNSHYSVEGQNVPGNLRYVVNHASSFC